jgi:hypothetical protein
MWSVRGDFYVELMMLNLGSRKVYHNIDSSSRTEYNYLGTTPQPQEYLGGDLGDVDDIIKSFAVEYLSAIALDFDASCKSILRSSDTSYIRTSDTFALMVVDSKPRCKLATVINCLRKNDDDRSGFATTVEQQHSQGHTWGAIIAVAIQRSSLRF